jgi:hypothetical protein
VIDARPRLALEPAGALRLGRKWAGALRLQPLHRGDELALQFGEPGRRDLFAIRHAGLSICHAPIHPRRLGRATKAIRLRSMRRRLNSRRSAQMIGKLRKLRKKCPRSARFRLRLLQCNISMTLGCPHVALRPRHPAMAEREWGVAGDAVGTVLCVYRVGADPSGAADRVDVAFDSGRTVWGAPAAEFGVVQEVNAKSH